MMLLDSADERTRSNGWWGAAASSDSEDAALEERRSGSLATSAERHLLAKDFDGARDISLGALDVMGHEDLAKSSGVRLAFVLGQALFELNELSDADKKLRRIYGSFTAIPDSVVVLWLTLLAEKGERGALSRFTDAYVKLNRKRIGGIAQGAFLQIYVVDVLCELFNEPGKATEWLEEHLAAAGDKKLRLSLESRIEEYKKKKEGEDEEKERKEKKEKGKHWAAEAERDTRARREGNRDGGLPSVGGEEEDKQGKSLLAGGKKKQLDSGQTMVAAAVGGLFLYALYRERKAMVGAARRAWDGTVGSAVSAVTKFLAE